MAVLGRENLNNIDIIWRRECPPNPQQVCLFTKHLEIRARSVSTNRYANRFEVSCSARRAGVVRTPMKQEAARATSPWRSVRVSPRLPRAAGRSRSAVRAPTSHGASKAVRRCDCDCVRGITEYRSGVPACADAYFSQCFSQWRPNIHGGVWLYIAPDQFRRRRIGLVSRYLLRNARFSIDLKIAAPLFLRKLLLPTHRGWPVEASVDHHVFRPASPELIFFLNPGPVHFPRHFATSIGSIYKHLCQRLAQFGRASDC